MLAGPLVVELVYNKHTITVTELNELAAIWIVRGAYVVQSELFHELDTFLHGTRIGSSTKGTQGVVVGIALEQHFPAIEQEAAVGSDFNGAHAKLLAHLVGHLFVLII